MFQPLRVLVGVVALQFLCQTGLLFIDDPRLRLPLRVAAFGISLVLLWLIPPGRYRHPAAWLGVLCLLILGFSAFNPETMGVIPALAAMGIYLAILAPLWWVSGLGVDVRAFQAVLLCIWALQSFSALLGVLQVQFPGRFDFQVSAIVLERGDAMVEGYRFTLPSGERIFRPMGLTDMPGGAASAGLISFVIAMGLVLTGRHPWLLTAAVVSMLNGLFCILTSHVRSILVMCFVCVAGLIGVLVLRGGGGRLVRIGMVVAVVAVVGTVWAFRSGGEEVVARVMSLFQEDPTTTYMQNRGMFLLFAIFQHAPEYPFGAGLGRWGMIYNYFGRFGSGGEPLWAEIQWEAWILDGGIPLTIAYFTAVCWAGWFSLSAALDRRIGALSDWSAVMFGYNLAAVAVTFNAPLFIGQGGMEFWLLNAALFAAVTGARRAQKHAAGHALPRVAA